MKVGIIGTGRLGFGMGCLWAEKGHQVCFSFSRSQDKLEESVQAVGARATCGSPEAAALFGEVVLLAVHWPQAPQVLREIRPHLAGKPLLTCVVPWKTNLDGLCLGTDTSAAEQIAVMAPEAHVIEALPLLADSLYVSVQTPGVERGSLFYCGNDATAKDAASVLIEDLDMSPIDAGDLKCARYLEPTMGLLRCLAIANGRGTDIALKLL